MIKIILLIVVIKLKLMDYSSLYISKDLNDRSISERRSGSLHQTGVSLCNFFFRAGNIHLYRSISKNTIKGLVYVYPWSSKILLHKKFYSRHVSTLLDLTHLIILLSIHRFSIFFIYNFSFNQLQLKIDDLNLFTYVFQLNEDSDGSFLSWIPLPGFVKFHFTNCFFDFNYFRIVFDCLIE